MTTPMQNMLSSTATDEAPVVAPMASEDDARTLKRLAIVIRDDAFDRLLTPLTFAFEMGRKGVQVDVLFVLWAVRVLTREGVEQVTMDPRHADRKDWLMRRLQRDGDPLTIHDFLKLIHGTGHVRLHACRLAAMTFDVSPDDLLPEAAGILDPARFLTDLALPADHCQYF